MKYTVDFMSFEEDDKDLIISFAIPDEALGVKSLILHRTLFFEEVLNEEEKGVKVSLEGEECENSFLNTLIKIEIKGPEVIIGSKYSQYVLDLSKIEASDKFHMIRLLKKQNHDERFLIVNE
jgi:hypothetical protein